MSRAQLTSTVEQNTGGAVSPYVAGKNCIINGGMDIFQRTSFATFNAYALDRWYIYGSQNVTVTQSTAKVTPNSQYMMLMTASATQQIFAYQAIETLNAIYYAGKTVTLSGYAAGLTTTTNLNMSLSYSTSTDNSVSGTWTGITASSGNPDLTLSGTVTRWSATYAIPSTAKSLRVLFVNNAANITVGQGIYLGDVQLEVGSVATPFSRAGGTLSGELDACQRYYYRVPLAGNVGIQFTFSGNATMAATVNFPTVMRATPTGFTNINSFTTSYSPTATQIYLNAYYVGNLSGTFGSATASAGSTTLGGLSLYSWTSPTTGLPYSIYGGSSCYLDWSAEL